MNTIPIFRPKSSEEQKKRSSRHRRPIFRPKSSEEQKKVLTSADVLFSTENIGEELQKRSTLNRSQKDYFINRINN